MAGGVSLVDAGEGFLGCGEERLAVDFDHGVSVPAAQACHSLATTTAGTDDFSHLPGDRLTIFHPQWVGISHRAADDGVSLGGPLVGLNENLAQWGDFVGFVEGGHAIGVCRRRQYSRQGEIDSYALDT